MRAGATQRGALSAAEQWALLRWKGRHLGAFVEDTTPGDRRWGRGVRLLHTLAGVASALASALVVRSSRR